MIRTIDLAGRHPVFNVADKSIIHLPDYSIVMLAAMKYMISPHGHPAIHRVILDRLVRLRAVTVVGRKKKKKSNQVMAVQQRVPIQLERFRRLCVSYGVKRAGSLRWFRAWLFGSKSLLAPVNWPPYLAAFIVRTPGFRPWHLAVCPFRTKFNDPRHKNLFAWASGMRVSTQALISRTPAKLIRQRMVESIRDLMEDSAFYVWALNPDMSLLGMEHNEQHLLTDRQLNRLVGGFFPESPHPRRVYQGWWVIDPGKEQYTYAKEDLEKRWRRPATWAEFATGTSLPYTRGTSDESSRFSGLDESEDLRGPDGHGDVRDLGGDSGDDLCGSGGDTYRAYRNRLHLGRRK